MQTMLILRKFFRIVRKTTCAESVSISTLRVKVWRAVICSVLQEHGSDDAFRSFEESGALVGCLCAAHEGEDPGEDPQREDDWKEDYECSGSSSHINKLVFSYL